MSTPSTPEAPRIVATVTAYNEAETIGGVIETLLRCPSIGRVQVVDDGSTDDTARIAAGFPVDLVRIPERVPVGQAIVRHLETVADDELVFWCDADLVGLEVEHVESTVRAHRELGVSQSISVKRVPWRGLRDVPLLKGALIRFFGSISGERLIAKETFERALRACRASGHPSLMTGYGIVIFLNWYCRRYGHGTHMLYHPERSHRRKEVKWGRWAFFERVSEWTQFVVVWLRMRWLWHTGSFDGPVEREAS